MARNQKAEAPQTLRVRYSATGPIEELRGTAWDVPVTVANKAAWIESQWREQQARAAAAAEQELRQQQVLSDRISQQRSGEVQALQLAEQRITALEERVQEPDLAKILNATTAFLSAVERTTALTNQLMEQEARAVEATERHGAVVAESAEYLAGVEEGRQQVLALVKGQQEIVSGSFASYASALQEFQKQLIEQQFEISALASKVADNWEVVDNAARINETAIGQARQAATELVTQQLDEFRVFLSVALQALGVKESDFTGALNRLDEGLQPGGFLISRGYIQQVVAIAQKYQAARDDAERRTLEAAALAPH